jgi:hypothetical protein
MRNDRRVRHLYIAHLRFPQNESELTRVFTTNPVFCSS